MIRLLSEALRLIVPILAPLLFSMAGSGGLLGTHGLGEAMQSGSPILQASAVAPVSSGAAGASTTVAQAQPASSQAEAETTGAEAQSPSKTQSSGSPSGAAATSPTGGKQATSSGAQAQPSTKTQPSSTPSGAGATSPTGGKQATSSGAPASQGSGAGKGESHEEDHAGDEEAQSEDDAGEGFHAEHVRSDVPEFSLGAEEIVVREGEEHVRDIVCVGGRVTIRGVVRGNVVVVGGVLTVSGHVRGDVAAVGSRTTLDSGARIDGAFTNVLGRVGRASNVTIEGGSTSVDPINLGRFASGRGIIAFFLWTIFWISLLITAIRFLCVLVVAAVAPQRVEGAVASPRPNWILAFLLGFVIRLFEIPLMILLILPCVTIPVAVALAIIIRIIVWMGLAAIALHVGRIAGRTFLRTDLSYFGAILAGYLLIAVVGFVPFVGWIFGGIVSCTGLGLMLLTRFGGRKQPAAPSP